MIICADFDKTIYFRDNDPQTIQNLAAIKVWHEKGNAFVLATNRSLKSLERVLPSWRDYFNYLILDGGTRIYDQNADILWSNTFSQKSVQELLATAHNFAAPSVITYYNLFNNDFSMESSSAMTKICIRFHQENEAEAFLAQIANVDVYTYLYTLDSTFQWSPDDNFAGYYACIEIVPASTDKSHAIHELAKLTQISLKDIITVGDNTNDYEMLTDFTGYAVKNSKISALHPELPTTPSVAELIKNFIK